MMKINVLRISYENPDLMAPDEIEVKTAEDLERIKIRASPAAYLLLEKDFSFLREFHEVVVDRGHKHKAKSLAKVMLGYQKIPLINGNFASIRQVKRSIRTLLSHAKNINDRNIYFIGIVKRVFDELTNRAKEEGDKRNHAAQIGRFDAHPPFGFSNVSLWLSGELERQFRVPRALMERYVGVSRDVTLVRQLIVLASRIETPVLIQGDTGTGKEVVAREIHENSNRKDQPLISINCSGIPTALFESELFGHTKGAFTGALQTKKGLWRLADKGTLFLDEIADLHLESQAKILRTLEDGYIRPVGGDTPFKVNARIVAAANRDLFSMVQRREFREDLYYRLRGFFIRTPSLRDNPENIPVLAQHLWKNITRSKESFLPQEVIERLGEYRWPGNVREMKMVLQNLYGLFSKENLGGEHLQAVFYIEGQEPLPPGRTTGPASCLKHLKRVQEAIGSIEIEFKNLILPKQDKRAVAASFGLRLDDLVRVCRRPSLFHSDSVFSAVWDLLKLLNQFDEQLKKKQVERETNWEKKLEEEFDSVQAGIEKEIEKVLKEL